MILFKSILMWLGIWGMLTVVYILIVLAFPMLQPLVMTGIGNIMSGLIGGVFGAVAAQISIDWYSENQRGE